MGEGNEETKEGNAFLSVVHWANFFWLAPVGFCIQLALLIATMNDKNRRLPGYFYRKVGVAAARLSPVWSFRVLKPIPDYRPSNTVVVCNHQSQADPMVVSQLPWEMKWLSKKSVFKIPVMGWSIAMTGDVPVVRGDHDSGKKALEALAQYLQRGMPIMIFPEGTRSRDDNMLPFKPGAFRLAIENGSDILPLAVVGSRAALPKGSWKVGRTKAYVAVGDPISTAGMTLDDLEALSSQTRAAMQELIDTLHTVTTYR